MNATKTIHSIPEPIAVEARARIMWGESPEKVRAFLTAKSVADGNAAALMEDILSERAECIRGDGIKKLWVGTLFGSAPVGYYFISQEVGYWSLKFFAALTVLGAFGLAKMIRGSSMVLRPRSVRGDLASATD